MTTWLRRWGAWLLVAIALLVPGAGALLYLRGRSKGKAETKAAHEAAADHVELELAKKDAQADALAATKIKQLDEQLALDMPHAGEDLEKIFEETNARMRQK